MKNDPYVTAAPDLQTATDPTKPLATRLSAARRVVELLRRIVVSYR